MRKCYRIISIVLCMILATSLLPMNATAKAKKSVKSISIKKSAVVTIPASKKSITKAFKVTVKVKRKASKKFTVKSSKNKVATAKISGSKVKITAKKAGKAIITVTTKGKNAKGKKLRAKLTLTVKKAVKPTVTKPVDVPESLVGSWYYLPNDYVDALFNIRRAGWGLTGKIFKEIKITSDGQVSANGKKYLLKRGLNNTYEKEYLGKFKEVFTTEIEKVKFRIYMSTSSDNSEFIVVEPYDNKNAGNILIYSNKKYIKKSAELTLDNWKDFFEVKFNEKCEAVKNEWGDVTGFRARGLELCPKEGVFILSIPDGRYALKCTTTETSLVRYNKTTGEYTYSDATPESIVDEREESIYNNGSGGRYNIAIGRREYDSTENAGDEYTARIATKADIEMTRIMGTINYITAE